MQFGKISFTPQRKLVRYSGFSSVCGSQTGTGKKASSAYLTGAGENVLAVDGVLRRGVGLISAYMPFTYSNQVGTVGFDRPQYVFCVKNGRTGDYDSYNEGLLGVDKGNQVFLYNPKTRSWVDTGIKCSSPRVHAFVDSEGVITTLLCGSTGIYTCDITALTLTRVHEEISYSACVCRNRLFYQNGAYTIAYSAPVQLSFTESIDEGGMLTLPSKSGRIMDMAAAGSYVYVFTERGVSRLCVSGTARDFVLQELGYDGGEIFLGSVSTCATDGEKLFFLATDGLYGIDGEKVKRVCASLPTRPRAMGFHCASAAVDGFYLVRFLDEKHVQRTWVYDVASGEGYYSFTIEGLSATTNGAAYCAFDSKIWKITVRGGLPEGVNAVFTAQTDFQTPGVKTWESAELRGEGSVELTVQTPTRERTFSLTFKEGVAQIPVQLRAKHFRLRIQLGEGATLRSLTACVRYATHVKQGGKYDD
jgi:hypothetical protein